MVLVQSLIHKGYVTAYFPLHNENQLYGFDRARHITNTEDREALKIEDLIKEDLVENEKQKIFGESYQFVKWEMKNVKKAWDLRKIHKLFDPPSSAIWDYFGEKIGYYFMFLGLYSKYQIIGLPFGIILFILFVVYESDSYQVQIFYCIYALITIIWSTVFLEHLKRSSGEKAVEWG